MMKQTQSQILSTQKAKRVSWNLDADHSKPSKPFVVEELILHTLCLLHKGTRGHYCERKKVLSLNNLFVFLEFLDM